MVNFTKEESIARSSTIISSLMTKPAERFYRSHRKDPKEGYYSHAMIYSPHVLFIRDDKGECQSPVEVDVVTQCWRQCWRRQTIPSWKKERRRKRNIRCNERKNGSHTLSVLKAWSEACRPVVSGREFSGITMKWLWEFGPSTRDSSISFDHVVFAMLGHSTFETFKRLSRKVFQFPIRRIAIWLSVTKYF